MMTVEVLLIQLPGLTLRDVERWILHDWVRPDGDAGAYAFNDMDVARVRLIQEMRDDLEIDESAIPVILLLIDQIYDLRRSMKEFHLDI